WRSALRSIRCSIFFSSFLPKPFNNCASTVSVPTNRHTSMHSVVVNSFLIPMFLSVTFCQYLLGKFHRIIKGCFLVSAGFAIYCEMCNSRKDNQFYPILIMPFPIGAVPQICHRCERKVHPHIQKP